MSTTETRDWFEPIGDLPKWRPLYDLYLTKNPGDIIGYDEISEVLGYDLRLDRSPHYRADKELQKNDQRALISVPRIGYQVATTMQHLGKSKHHQGKGRRQVTKAIRVLTATDLSQALPQVQEQFRQQGMKLQRLEEEHIRATRRMDKMDEESKQRQKAYERDKEDILRRMDSYESWMAQHSK